MTIPSLLRLCRRSLLAGLLALLSAGSAAGQAVPWLPETAVRFATPGEAAAVLERPDRFLTRLSPFDLQSRMRQAAVPTLDEFRASLRQQPLAWSNPDRLKVQGCLARLQARLVEHKLPFPPEILLVQTTGREEGNAAYCREQTIVLPRSVVARNESTLERLIAHELFHILSQHNRQRVRELYSLVGFHACPEIKLPARLAGRKITNPDAPEIDCYIELRVDEEKLSAAPVLLSTADQFDPSQGKSFFDYMVFRLLVLQERDGVWSPAERDGEPWLLNPRELPDYQAQIGRNTSYIIHPEELLADNFMHAVMGTADLPDPQIPRELLRGLRREQP